MRVAPSTFTGPVYALQPDVVLLPEGDRTDFVLVIQDDLIADVLPLPDVAAKWPALHVTRLNGFAIVPGFVDAHHHVIEPFAKAVTFGEPAQMWKRIWMPLEAVADAESCYHSAKWTFLEALRGGVTTVVEHAIRDLALVEAVNRAAEDTGIRLVSSTGGYDLKNFASTAKTPDASASVDSVLALAEAHIALCAQFSRVYPSLACGTVQSNSAAMIAAIAQFCRARAILFQIHANEHTVEVHACLEAYGRRPIEVLGDLDALGKQTLIAHVTLVTAHEIELLRTTDTAISYNPVAAMWKGNAIAPALEYATRGIRMGLGSDATRNDGFRMLDAAESCQRIAYGIPQDDFSCGAGWTWVHAATQGGADAIGLGAITGSIAAGKQADFLVLDRRGPEVTPSWDFTWELVRYYDRADIAATVVAGRAVVIDGAATGFNSARFVAEQTAPGVEHLESAGITRLHGTSAARRPSPAR
jgi:cytosine/adenosine deaminase-related metal-dependent hydrolase